MRTETVFIVILIGVFFNISGCSGATCSCNCCAGNSCKLTLQGTITVASCTSSSCKSLCQSKYPTQCTDGAGRTSYQCTSSSVSSADWTGVFNIANTCDQSFCCCPIGQMNLSRINTNTLRIQCQFVGDGCEDYSFLDQAIPTPNDYSTQIGFLGNSILVTLSQDSRTIELHNPVFPQCSETGTKNNPSSDGTTVSSGETTPFHNVSSKVTNTMMLVFLLTGLIRLLI